MGKKSEKMIKLILYCSGLGYINRGLESFTRELYETLLGVDNIDISLFQGKGDVLDGAHSVWAPKRTSNYDKFLPLDLNEDQKHLFEDLIFSFPILFSAYRMESPIIHFSESIPAKVLYHLRKRFGGSFHLLFSNGGPRSPKYFDRYDYVQVLTPEQKKEALDYGYPSDRLFMVPYGLDCQKFNSSSKSVRSDWNLPTDRKILLSVGAINTGHKRMHWLIKEFAKLNQSKYFLWLVGQSDGKQTAEVKKLAENVLDKDSYRFTTTSYEKMPEVYNSADIFVLCSLREGFGRVYLEAMASKLPVIAHRTENTEWILGSENMGLIDMTIKDELADKIRSISNKPDLLNELGNENSIMVEKNFDWKSLLPDYIQMYENILK